MDKPSLLHEMRQVGNRARAPILPILDCIEKEQWAEAVQKIVDLLPAVMSAKYSDIHPRGDALSLVGELARDARDVEILKVVLGAAMEDGDNLAKPHFLSLALSSIELFRQLPPQMRDGVFELASYSLPSSAIAHLARAGAAPSEEMEMKLLTWMGDLAREEVRKWRPYLEASRSRESLRAATGSEIRMEALAHGL